ncbi:MAG: hypothetical protein H0V66_05175 [Bdellovibrionales bacterium]|nr:hypothetical protein [Bdellovibrionales bacterium]
MIDLLSGYLLALCLVTAIFFLKFWIKTKDRFFALFASAFAIMGVERIVLFMLGSHKELTPTVYFIRLSAFILILFGIYMKNKESEGSTI